MDNTPSHLPQNTPSSTNQLLIRALLAIWSITLIIGIAISEVWVAVASFVFVIGAIIVRTTSDNRTLPLSQMVAGATLIPGLAGLIFPYSIAFHQKHLYDGEPFFGPLEDWFFAFMFLLFAAIPVTLLAISAVSILHTRQTKQKLSPLAISIGLGIGVAFVAFIIVILRSL